MRTKVLLIAGIAAVGMMASCASDKDDSPGNKGEKATVNLSFATGGTTRTSATTDDNGSTIGTLEGTVNNVAFGIFDSNGYRLSTSMSTPDGIKEIKDYDLKGNGASSVSVTVSSSATKIIAIGNVPSGSFTATTSTDYVDGTKSTSYPELLSYTTDDKGAANTLMNTVNSQKITGLPMHGEQSITFTTSNSSSTANPSVTFERMVARVCLSQLSCDFSASNDKTADKTASFVPSEIFMYNVNDKLTAWGTSPTVTSTLTEPTAISTDGTWGACEVTGSSTTPAQLTSLPNTAYLSSGLISLTGTANATTTTQTDYINVDKTSASAYSFYVFPHNATSPTKLIIKGLYTSSDGTKSILYYPIIINHWNSNTTLSKDGGVALSKAADDDSQISANTLYEVKVIIKGRGVTDPSQNLEPSTVNVSMAVSKWNNTTQTVVIQ